MRESRRALHACPPRNCQCRKYYGGVDEVRAHRWRVQPLEYAPLVAVVLAWSRPPGGTSKPYARASSGPQPRPFSPCLLCPLVIHLPSAHLLPSAHQLPMHPCAVRGLERQRPRAQQALPAHQQDGGHVHRGEAAVPGLAALAHVVESSPPLQLRSGGGGDSSSAGLEGSAAAAAWDSSPRYIHTQLKTDVYWSSDPPTCPAGLFQGAAGVREQAQGGASAAPSVVPRPAIGLGWHLKRMPLERSCTCDSAAPMCSLGAHVQHLVTAVHTGPSPHPPGHQVLFYTDPGSRRLYKDHVRTVSQRWGAQGRCGGHAEVQGEEAWQGGRRWARGRALCTLAGGGLVEQPLFPPPPSPSLHAGAGAAQHRERQAVP